MTIPIDAKGSGIPPLKSLPSRHWSFAARARAARQGREQKVKHAGHTAGLLKAFYLNIHASEFSKTPPIPNELIHLKEQVAKGKTFNEAFKSLSAYEQGKLKAKVGEERLQAFAQLSNQEDKGRYWKGVMGLTEELKRNFKSKEMQQAGVIFSEIAQGERGIPNKIQEEARLQHDAIIGNSSDFRRTEVMLGGGVHIAMDPRMALPVVFAPMLGQVVNTKLKHLMSLSKQLRGARWFNAGIKGRSIAQAGSFSLETMAFAQGGRFLYDITDGGVPWGPQDFILSTYGAGITLASLKGFGFVGNQIYARTLGVSELVRSTGLARLSQGAFHQASGYGGLVMAHFAEARAGLIGQMPNGNPWVDALQTHLTLQFGIAGARNILGPRLWIRNQQYGLEGEMYYTGRLNPNQPNQSDPGKWEQPIQQIIQAIKRRIPERQDMITPTGNRISLWSLPGPKDIFFRIKKDTERNEESGGIRKRVSVNRDWAEEAFLKVITQLKASGKKVSYHKATQLAHEIYVRDLPKADWPSRHTFRLMVSGAGANPKIVKMLEESGVVAKNLSIVDQDRAENAFLQTITKLKDLGKKASYHKATQLAHEIYVRDLPEADRPSRHTFRLMVSGARANPKIVKILKESGVVVKQISIDLERAENAFSQVTTQLKASGKKVNLKKATELAHEIYVRGLTKADRPSRGTFQYRVSGPGANPQIKKMLMESGVVAKNLSIVDQDRAEEAFLKVTTKLKASGKKVSFKKAAEMAHEIYVRDLPEADRPSRGTFRNMVSGSGANPKIVKILKESGVVVKRISIELERAENAFSQVTTKLKASGKKASSHKATQLAHEIYVRGLTKADRPSRGTFRNMVSGPGANPQIVKILMESGVVVKNSRSKN